MADQTQSADKHPPDDIELRVRPRPVARINRRVLMGGTALLSVVLLGAVLLALDPPDWRGGQVQQELYNTDRKATAEGLANLPSTYDAIPKLGPPLPGDFGDALHKVDTGRGQSFHCRTGRSNPILKPISPGLTAFAWRALPSRAGSQSCFIPCRPHGKLVREMTNPLTREQ